MTTDVVLVLVTCPPDDTAKKIANLLIENRLAACVNILPAMTSVYRWKGVVQQDAEQLLIIKTARPIFEQVSAAVRAAHPYELPEIVAVPIESGLPEYLSWVRESVISI